MAFSNQALMLTIDRQTTVRETSDPESPFRGVLEAGTAVVVTHREARSIVTNSGRDTTAWMLRFEKLEGSEPGLAPGSGWILESSNLLTPSPHKPRAAAGHAAAAANADASAASMGKAGGAAAEQQSLLTGDDLSHLEAELASRPSTPTNGRERKSAAGQSEPRPPSPSTGGVLSPRRAAETQQPAAAVDISSTTSSATTPHAAAESEYCGDVVSLQTTSGGKDKGALITTQLIGTRGNLSGSFSRVDLSAEFSLQNGQKHRFMLHPDHPFSHSWHWIVGVLCIYVALAIPFRIGFQVELCPDSYVFWVEVVIDAFFTIDILLNFRTGLQIGEVVEMNPTVICWKYLRTYFFIDAISILPIGYIAIIAGGTCGIEGESGSDSFKLFKIVRLFRLLKV